VKSFTLWLVNRIGQNVPLAFRVSATSPHWMRESPPGKGRKQMVASVARCVMCTP
jgi:hypothetical protein